MIPPVPVPDRIQIYSSAAPCPAVSSILPIPRSIIGPITLAISRVRNGIRTPSIYQRFPVVSPPGRKIRVIRFHRIRQQPGHGLHGCELHQIAQVQLPCPGLCDGPVKMPPPFRATLPHSFCTDLLVHRHGHQRCLQVHAFKPRAVREIPHGLDSRLGGEGAAVGHQQSLLAEEKRAGGNGTPPDPGNSSCTR